MDTDADGFPVPVAPPTYLTGIGDGNREQVRVVRDAADVAADGTARPGAVSEPVAAWRPVCAAVGTTAAGAAAWVALAEPAVAAVTDAIAGEAGAAGPPDLRIRPVIGRERDACVMLVRGGRVVAAFTLPYRSLPDAPRPLVVYATTPGRPAGEDRAGAAGQLLSAVQAAADNLRVGVGDDAAAVDVAARFGDIRAAFAVRG